MKTRPPDEGELADILRFAGDTRPGVVRLAMETICAFVGVEAPQDATVPIIRRPMKVGPGGVEA